MNTSKENMTVLVADDEPEIQNVLKRFLSRRGYDILFASNGKEALGKACVQAPGLVLLDINMPDMNGFTVCERLRENPNTRLTPVLMLTGRSGLEDKIRGLQNGADDYITKPFELDELQARIDSLLKRTHNMVSVNPLTRLPGTPSIQEEIERRISEGKSLGVAYFDIDNFKAYNDSYGYNQGDKVILWTAKMIQNVAESLNKHAPFEHMLGHVGGDDFILVAPAEVIRVISELVAIEFDKNRSIWYSWWDKVNGSIQTKNRQGNSQKFPLMTLSVSVSTNGRRKITHYGEVAQITSELKSFAKNREEKNKSFVAFDRRIN